jgi:PTS system N-acetylglucosamine-specific IIC component
MKAINDFFIRILNKKTPQKEDKNPETIPDANKFGEEASFSQDHELYTAQQYIFALGGKENIIKADNDGTRIIFKLIDSKKIDEIRAKKLGAKGIIRKGNASIHLIIGYEAEVLTNQINKVLLTQSQLQFDF